MAHPVAFLFERSRLRRRYSARERRVGSARAGGRVQARREYLLVALIAGNFPPSEHVGQIFPGDGTPARGAFWAGFAFPRRPIPRIVQKLFARAILRVHPVQAHASALAHFLLNIACWAHETLCARLDILRLEKSAGTRNACRPVTLGKTPLGARRALDGAVVGGPTSWAVETLF